MKNPLKDWWSSNHPKEPGVGRGNYSDNHGGHTYNENGLTERQQEVLDTYIAYGGKATAAARALGFSGKNRLYDALQDIAERWDLDELSAAAVLEEYDRRGDNRADRTYEVADSYDTSSSSDNDDAPTIDHTDPRALGSNPWSGYWDRDGNWIE